MNLCMGGPHKKRVAMLCNMVQVINALCLHGLIIVQLIGEREVKGVVKLKFHDITGCTVVCSRILQSTQKVGCYCVLCTSSVYNIILIHICILLAEKTGAENTRFINGEDFTHWRSTQ